MNDSEQLSPELESLFRPLIKPMFSTGAAVSSESIFFRLDRDDYGFYVSSVNGSGKEIDPLYEYYSGPEREILKEISQIREARAFRIEWGEMSRGEKCYLRENEDLVSMLLKTNLFQTADGELISAVEEPVRLEAVIEKTEAGGESESTFMCRFWLAHEQERIDGAVPVTPLHLLSGNTIYPVKPMGPHFDKLSLFETPIRSDLLEQFMTMLISTVHHVHIHCKGFKTVEGEPQITRPAIIFENVTPDNTLHMKVAATYPGYAPGFFEKFEIDTIAVRREMEKRVVVSKLSHGDIAACFKEIQTALRKHAKSLTSGNASFSDDNFIVVEADLASRFITHELSGLLTKHVVLGAEKLKAYKVKYLNPRLNVTLSHGIDFLEGDATLDFEGETLTLNDVLKQYRKSAYITLGDGTRALVNPDYMSKLSRIFKQKKAGVKVSFFDLPIVEEMIDEKVSRQALGRSKDIFLGFNALEHAKLSLPNLNATLRSYQLDGVKWLNYLHQHGLGGCLADDMGLGKTVQTIALLTSIYSVDSPVRERYNGETVPSEDATPLENLTPSKDTALTKDAPLSKNNGNKKESDEPIPLPPSLIVMPKTLLFNWESELNKFAPHLSFCFYYGQDRDIESAMTRQVILTTYAVVRNDIEILQEKEFHLIVLDESQNIKNILSKTSKASVLLNAEHRLALSGTPIENNLSELYALFRFLNPSMFGSFNDFNRNYLTPIQKQGDKAVTGELRRKIYPFILRRLKMDVLTDLPERMEQTLFVEMSEEQKKLYHQRRQMYKKAIQEEIQKNGVKKAQFFILQALGELRQIASIPEVKSDNTIISPKREILMEHVRDVVAGDHKVLVFANFLHTLECVSQDMESAGIDHMVMTGSTRDRSAVVNRFQNDDTCKALLMTLKTGGLGLNLTAAEYVFLFDPWWNAAAENQAIDRAHRMGQTNTVFSYRLIARESIEEKIMKLQEAKRELFDSLISSDSASIKQLSEEDVDFVLGDNAT